MRKWGAWRHSLLSNTIHLWGDCNTSHLLWLKSTLDTIFNYQNDSSIINFYYCRVLQPKTTKLWNWKQETDYVHNFTEKLKFQLKFQVPILNYKHLKWQFYLVNLVGVLSLATSSYIQVETKSDIFVFFVENYF